MCNLINSTSSNTGFKYKSYGPSALFVHVSFLQRSYSNVVVGISVCFISHVDRVNKDKNFLVWINEEDHMRVIAMEKGGNLKGTFERFCHGLQSVCMFTLFSRL